MEILLSLLNLISCKTFWSSIIINFSLALIIWISCSIAQRFINSEFKKNRKVEVNKFDKIIIIFAGIIFSIICCIAGIEALSTIYTISKELISVVVMFSGMIVFVRAIVTVKLIQKKPQCVSERDFIIFRKKLYRITFFSFFIAAITSCLFSLDLSNNVQSYIVDTSAFIILLYYFLEEYLSKNTITKCFMVEPYQEYSIGAKLVDFINDKFIFLSLIGMVAAIAVNKRADLSNDLIIYSNIRDMFLATIIMLLVQILMSSLVNKVMLKLANLESGKITKKSVASRKKNLLWICDVLVISSYFSIFIIILWYMGINIQKYIFHDTIVTIGLVIFITILLYNAFKEFTDALIDKAPPTEHERILTFMPVVSVIFNVTIIGISGTIILSKLGVAIVPLLASFTAISAAIALAAQDIIKGFLQGITLLLENNFYVGDFITIGNISGVVEKMSTRTIILRDLCGDVHIIPYDIIKTITNHSKDYYIHFEQMLLSPYSNVEKAIELLIDTTNQLKKEPKFADKIYGDVSINGIQSFSSEGIKISWSLRTSSSAAGRILHLEIYKRLFEAFKKENIDIPYSQLLLSEKPTK